MKRTLASLVAATGLALALTACGDDPKTAPQDKPTDWSTVSTGASPDATDDTAVSLTPVQVVRAWFKGLNQLIESGDGSAARSLITNNCGTCDEEIRPIEETFEDGGHYRLQGRGWIVKSVKLRKSDRHSATVLAAYAGSSGQLVPSKNATPVPFEGEHSIVEIHLVKHPQGWRIKFIGYIT